MSRKIDGKNGNEDEEMDTHDRHLMTTVRAVFAEESQHEMEDVKSFGLGLVKAANVDRVVDEPAKVYKEKGTHDYSSAGNEERPSISAT
ncbi:unnamed protein product [Sphagnum tenellum]